MIRIRAFVPLLAVLLLPAIPRHAWAGDFGPVPGSTTIRAENRDGTLDTQAGSHPYAFSVHFDLKTNEAGETEGGTLRDVLTDLPPGLFGNPRAVPTCTWEAFEGGPACAPSTQVGVLRVVLPEVHLEFFGPIYNLEAPPGAAAELGFRKVGFVALLSASVGPGNGYGVHIESPNLPLEASSATVTIWGNPADPSHDPERGSEGGTPAGVSPLPFLTLPTSCGSPLQATLEFDSKSAIGVFVGGDEPAILRDAGGNPQALTGCEAVPFSPAITAAPSASAAESGSGFDFQLHLPNHGLLSPREGIATETEPEKTVVTLPQGLAVNPAAASGQGVCTLDQYEAAACPGSAKLGTLVAKTPLLEEAIEGSVYLAAPHENPFGSLLGLYVIAKAPNRGVLVKLAGPVEADPVTGQLTTTFDDLPPLPYSAFELKLREGPRAPLITPQTCGKYTTVAKLYPFSAPGSATERTAPFEIASGAEGGSCAGSEAELPNQPTLEAGATAPVAGAYSPFVFRVKREDGDQRIGSVQATLPTGLLGKLAGVPYCPESGLATAASRTAEGQGAVELASPSCPAASQIGVVNVSAGAGSQPYVVQGKAYLAGPYKGAALSLEIVTPAIAGPFDLGSVAVRTALFVDPLTAQIHAESDPLPTILHGIPLDVRTISLQMDRPDFTLNPTNCQGKTVTGSVTSLAGQSVSLSNPFAVGGCQGLDFKPSLKLSFSGQTKRTGNPAVRAVLTQPKGENANLAGATVILPKGMFIAQAHINSPCTRVEFNSTPIRGEACPAKSVLGTAKVWTPLLDAPEEGNVYFRSNGGERELPDLVVSLQGQVPLQLVGFVDSVGRKGAEVRRVRSRFLNIPDAPVSRFELKLSGGKKGLLENSQNLCKAGNRAKFQLTGQNGKTYKSEPKVRVTCKGQGRRGSKSSR